jgi:hypothetical protein
VLRARVDSERETDERGISLFQLTKAQEFDRCK